MIGSERRRYWPRISKNKSVPMVHVKLIRDMYVEASMSVKSVCGEMEHFGTPGVSGGYLATMGGSPSWRFPPLLINIIQFGNGRFI